MIDKFTITKPDDWHVHLRDSQMLDVVVLDTVKQFARAVVMPNLQIPVITTEMAIAYRERILNSIEKLKSENRIEVGNIFEPLMTIYLQDSTPSEEVLRAKKSGVVFAFKLYPASSTTNSQHGVVDLLGNCSELLENLQKVGMPLLVHSEVSDRRVDIFDRERVFIDRVMVILRKISKFKNSILSIFLTKEGVDFVLDDDNSPIAATITPQHLIYNRNDIFFGGLNPHLYCLPILKKEEDRIALLNAATSGNKKFFLGTDSAPHDKSFKENACSCAGCYNASHAMSLYASIFDSVGRLDNLELFASFNGPDFYNLPRNKELLTLYKEDNIVPNELTSNDIKIIPLSAGKILKWLYVAVFDFNLF
ncbi:dihydroorotase [Candidatus Kinetoplastibacterium desouzaii TCC079E]|uniref:Dihydroorotase n=1 Tax=Candidatus Kinetoplastidibacterium desouzai TCC079E TaxID=1208919 RepID=M1LN32_9PROT|nr:dihydroorotase [Candidatus Kinetoplastibacterium desouzaii]AGF47127.1 dihydroorotase [Candidatus Kinetoplastibacterium desouzaii TCC079E]